MSRRVARTLVVALGVLAALVALATPAVARGEEGEIRVQTTVTTGPSLEPGGTARLVDQGGDSTPLVATVLVAGVLLVAGVVAFVVLRRRGRAG